MKKLLLLLLFIPLVSFGQDYGNNVDAMKLCTVLQTNNFGIDAEAEKGLDRILSEIGASKRFVLQPCDNINNAVAASYKGIRYILYDRDFMYSLNNGNNWGNLFILAHEVGHHINGHSVDMVLYLNDVVKPESLANQRKQELEADEFAGFVFAKMGGPIEAANQLIEKISSNKNDSYSTHPSTDKRLDAVRKGYYRINPSNDKSNKSRITDVIFFKDGSRWEGPVKLDSYYADDGKQILKVTEKTPYGKGTFIYRDGRIHKGYYSESLHKNTLAYKLALANNYYYKALDFWKKENYYKAQQNITQALAIKKNDTRYMVLQADIFFHQGKKELYVQALEWYEKAYKFGEDTYWVNYIIGSLEYLKQNKDYAKIIFHLEKAVELSPSNTLLSHNLLGRIYFYQRRSEEAMKVFTIAIDKKEAQLDLKLDPEAYFLRGIMYGSSGEINKAIEDNSKYIELEENNIKKARGYFGRAIGKYQLEDYRGFCDDMNKASKLDPENDKYKAEQCN